MSESDQTAPVKGGAIRGGAAIGASNAGRQLLRLAIMIVLARILTPDEFGVVAVMTAMFAVAAVFQELGLTAATVQKGSVSTDAVSTLFWINAAAGLVLALLFELLAPLIAWFFARPELIPLCRVAALTFLLNGLMVQHRALLQRNMQFGKRATADLSAAAIGGAGALLLAIAGFGTWALVAQILLTDLVTLTLTWWAVRFVPGRPVWTHEVHEMLRFSGPLLAFNVVVSLAQNLSTALLGRGTGAAAAGLYTRAFALANIPQLLLYGAATHVALPRLSRVKDSAEAFASFYCQGVQLMALATVPVAAIFAVFGEQLALFVYGPQWGEVGVLLSAFAPGLAAAPLLHSTGQIFLARGESHRMLRWGLFGTGVIGIGTVVGLRWGALGVACGWSATTLLLLLPGLHYAFRGSAVTLGRVVLAVRGVYAATAGMAIIGWAARELLAPLAPWLQLPLGLAIAATAYLALSWFLCGQRALIESVFARLLRRTPDRAE